VELYLCSSICLYDVERDDFIFLLDLDLPGCETIFLDKQGKRSISVFYTSYAKDG
jgi:hypothetical protein